MTREGYGLSQSRNRSGTKNPQVPTITKKGVQIFGGKIGAGASKGVQIWGEAGGGGALLFFGSRGSRSGAEKCGRDFGE